MTLTTLVHVQSWFVGFDITIIQLIAVIIASMAVLTIFHGHAGYAVTPIDGWPPDIRWWATLARVMTWLDRIVTLILSAIILLGAVVLLGIAWMAR